MRTETLAVLVVALSFAGCGEGEETPHPAAGERTAGAGEAAAGGAGGGEHEAGGAGGDEASGGGAGGDEAGGGGAGGDEAGGGGAGGDEAGGGGAGGDEAGGGGAGGDEAGGGGAGGDEAGGGEPGDPPERVVVTFDDWVVRAAVSEGPTVVGLLSHPAEPHYAIMRGSGALGWTDGSLQPVATPLRGLELVQSFAVGDGRAYLCGHDMPGSTLVAVDLATGDTTHHAEPDSGCLSVVAAGQEAWAAQRHDHWANQVVLQSDDGGATWAETLFLAGGGSDWRFDSVPQLGRSASGSVYLTSVRLLASGERELAVWRQLPGSKRWDEIHTEKPWPYAHVGVFTSGAHVWLNTAGGVLVGTEDGEDVHWEIVPSLHPVLGTRADGLLLATTAERVLYVGRFESGAQPRFLWVEADRVDPAGPGLSYPVAAGDHVYVQHGSRRMRRSIEGIHF